MQPPPDHLVAQTVGILPNRRPGRELIFLRAVGIDLLPDAFVIMNQPLIRHFFDAHVFFLMAIGKQLKNVTVPQPCWAQNRL